MMRCFHGPCVAALHVWVALIVPGCVHVCLRFAVDVGSSGVCMFHVLILMSILALNCEVLYKNYVLLLLLSGRLQLNTHAPHVCGFA